MIRGIGGAGFELLSSTLSVTRSRRARLTGAPSELELASERQRERATERQQELRGSLEAVSRLQEALRSLRSDLKLNRVEPAAASVVSRVEGGFDATATRLGSTEELNVSEVSFSASGGTLSLDSTSSPRLVSAEGVEHDVFGLEVKQGGTIGADDPPSQIRIEVRDGDGKKVETLQFDSSDPAGTEHVLANGLVIAFGEGTLVDKDYFQIDSSLPPGEATLPQAVASVSGDFDGPEDDTLTVKVTASGTVGSGGNGDLKFEVRDGDGLLVDKITFGEDLPAGTPLELSNGLSLAFAAGTLDNGDKFSVSAVADGPSSIAAVSQPRVSGNYQGPNDVFTFRFREGGVVGSDSPEETLRFEVRDGADREIETVSFSSAQAPETPMTLQNGITVQFSAGTIVKDAEFQVDVSNEPAAPNPDAPFDGIYLDAPGLESHVGEGSFEVNGVEIDVAADDTIHSVLDRINGSVENVLASYDVETERVNLERTDTGPLELSVGNDTSGFLAAVKLSDASPVLGHDGGGRLDADELIADQAPLEDVQAGTISVNGTEIAIDPRVDTLDDVLERVRQGVPGVEADVIARSGQVRFFATDERSALNLDDGETGFFDALGISEGSHLPRSGDEGLGRRARAHAVAAVSDVTESLNALFETEAPVTVELARTRRNLRDVIVRSLGDRGDRASTAFGLRFDFGDSGQAVSNFGAGNRQKLESALANRPEGVARTLVGHGTTGRGLVGDVLSVLDDVSDELRRAIAAGGPLLDVYA